MPVPAITITLEATPDSVTFRAPEPEIPVGVVVPGVVHRTQAGSLIKYQTGPAYFEVALSIPHLTDAQKNTLEDFFRDHWGDDITYTDENSNEFTVQFLDSTLPLVKAQRGLWTVSLRLNFAAVLI